MRVAPSTGDVRGLPCQCVRSCDRCTDSSRGRRGAPARELSGRAREPLRPAGQAQLEPLPGTRRARRPRPRHVRADRCHRRRSRGTDRRRGRHVHLRRPRGRDPALRAGPSGGAAAQDHHARRRRHRPGHRVDVVPQRAAARVRAGDGHPDRRRGAGHRVARRAHGPVSRLPQFVRDARLRRAAAHRARARPAVRRADPPAVPCAPGPGGGDGAHHRNRPPRRDARRLPRRGGVQPGGELSVRRRADRGIRPRQRLHRPADLLPVHPARRPRQGRTGSRSPTICGAGTPTGSGVRGRSAPSIRSFVASGHGGTCAAASTGSS